MSAPLPEQRPSPPDPASGRRPASRPVGCWKACGIGCGVLICLFGVLFLMLFLVARPQMGAIITHTRLLTRCAQKLQGDRGLQGALQRYHDRNHAYPPRLLDLFPTYVSRRSVFHCPADHSPPSNVSYVYRCPTDDAPGAFIVLTCSHHGTPEARFRLDLPLEGSIRQRMVGLSSPGTP